MVTKSSTEKRPQTLAAEVPAQPESALGRWTKKHSLTIFLLLVAVASLRIVATYHVFSQTSDEPPHIACGMEWLSRGTYHYEAQHPPLARVAVALGPFLAGVRSFNLPGMADEGIALIYRDGHGDRNLALARLGILPFFWIACTVVYLWTKRYCGEPSAAFAVLCFTFLPPVLAHAGLATTDMPLTAMTGASFFAGLIWLNRPNILTSLAFGAITALAVLSKFSSLAFLPSSCAVALLWFLLAEPRPFRQALQAIRACAAPSLLVVTVMLLVVWAGYRFSYGVIPAKPDPLDAPGTVKVPAPELFAGINQVEDHNSHGHASYLLGEQGQTGWWYYYFVVLAVKTPLPFLALLGCGVGLIRRKNSSPAQRRGVSLALAFSAGIVLFALTSQINIGVRHVLPVYIGFSMVAGAGAARLLDRPVPSRWVLSFLLLWLAATSALSHPDYLSYFNALAGRHPERIVVDSDLDWGQDMKRLAQRLKQVGAQSVAFTPYFPVNLRAEGFPEVHPLNPLHPVPGWNAVGLTYLKTLSLGERDAYPPLPLWPEHREPTEKIGAGIWLFYISPNTPQN